jgi:lysozyme family protein
MKDNFDDALRRVLAHEGGYSNHPADRGGPTQWGVTLADARMYWKRDATAEDVKAMPRDVAKRIYKAQYWDKMRCDELPSGVDYAVFDFGVNSGVSRSIKYLEAIANVPQDGKADDLLIRTVAHMAPNTVIMALCNRRLAFLKGLKTWGVFGKGWGRRVDEVKAASLKMASYMPNPAPRVPPNDEPRGKTPREDQKPAVKSKTVWAQILSAFSAVGSLFMGLEWQTVLVLCIVGLALFVILERTKKTDIVGWL